MFTKMWWKLAGVRALRTMAQVFVASAGMNVFTSGINATDMAYLVLGSGLCSFCTSIAFGLPEAEDPTDPRVGVN